MGERLLAAGLLLVALAPLAWMLFGPRRSAPADRGRYPMVLAASWLRFGLTTIVVLGVMGRWSALVLLPPEFAPVQVLLGVQELGAGERLYLAGAGGVGVAIGVAAGLVLSACRAWRGKPEGTLFGDASAIRPGEPGDLGWAAAVAVTAGLTEEAYFRLLLPLLMVQVAGDAVVAFGVAALLFGAAHRYQGWRGMAATAVVALGLTSFYLTTGSLWAAMAVHAAGDLGHLVLRPAVRMSIQRR
ncbi:CPBP family intramembrane glutamic endopeptidase [Sphingomonas sp.]|uniref:CPBP family intramembrane glutamic endopeptidase n=1 Tax=Sphingomonas sp. TaxID=28214 RepID=UPI003CC6CCAB